MLVDANILVYAHDASSPYHRPARAWMEAKLNGRRRVGIPWASILAFLRLTTNPRVAARPLTSVEAWGHVETWLAAPPTWVPSPTDRHAGLFGELVTTLHLTANLIPDAHLAALALEHGLELCSADSDFARFPRLRWTNPLLGG